MHCYETTETSTRIEQSTKMYSRSDMPDRTDFRKCIRSCPSKFSPSVLLSELMEGCTIGCKNFGNPFIRRHDKVVDKQISFNDQIRYCRSPYPVGNSSQSSSLQRTKPMNSCSMKIRASYDDLYIDQKYASFDQNTSERRPLNVQKYTTGRRKIYVKRAIRDHDFDSDDSQIQSTSTHGGITPINMRDDRTKKRKRRLRPRSLFTPRDLNETCNEGDTNKPPDSDSTSPPSPMTNTPHVMETRAQGKLGSPSVFCTSIGALGRISPGHDLGYHTLVTRQTPTPTPRDRTTTPSPWTDVRASPFPARDLSNLSSCPRSSPRPQLPQIPPQQQTPLVIETTEQLMSAFKTKRQQKPSPFEKLPDEMVSKILSFLPTMALINCGRVCRRWYTLVWNPRLWTTISLSGENLPVDKALKHITKLLSRDSGKCLNIQKLLLNGCSRLSDRGLSMITKRCPQVRHINIKGCTSISNMGIFEAVSHCANLEHLDVTGCYKITCINISPTTPAEQEILHPRQLYLQYLDLTDCAEIQDSQLKIIVQNCPQLLHLYLRRCVNVTDMGIKYIASYCLMLREVSISDCVLITDFGLYELARLGPSLRYLSVAKCDQVSDAGVKQIARHCYKLRYLNVRGCEAVSDDSMEMIARSCPRIRALDIGKCDVTDNGMKMISKNCPNLRRLSVKSCDMITDLGIHYISYYCRGLQQLNIQDCQVTVEGYRTVKRYCRRCIIEHTNPGFY